MGLRTSVILNSVKNLSDARYGAGMGVEMIGFSFSNGEPSHLTIEEIKAVMGWIEGVLFIGEFESTDTVTINQLCDELGFDYVLINHTQSIDGIEKEIILTYDIEDKVVDLKGIDKLLIRSNSYDGKVLDYASELKLIAQEKAVYLGFGVNDDNVNNLIETIPVKGISLVGGEEEHPGQNNYDEIADIFEALEED